MDPASTHSRLVTRGGVYRVVGVFHEIQDYCHLGHLRTSRINVLAGFPCTIEVYEGKEGCR
jgi:hypothetical protein